MELNLIERIGQSQRLERKKIGKSNYIYNQLKKQIGCNGIYVAMWYLMFQALLANNREPLVSTY